jgi:hypothetical protein
MAVDEVVAEVVTMSLKVCIESPYVRKDTYHLIVLGGSPQEADTEAEDDST